MGFLECIRLSFGNIRVNKLRSFLTMLGIIIGISSVITITTIGNSMKLTISNTMNDLGGANMIYGYLDASSPEDENDWETWVYPELTEQDRISDEMIEQYKESFSDEVSHVIVSEPMESGKAVHGENYAYVDMSGISAGYLDSAKIEILQGRNITEQDCQLKKHACVVSDLFVKYYFQGQEINPIGQEILIDTDSGTSFHGVIAGVYKYDAARFGGNFGSKTAEKDRPTTVFLPVSTAKQFNQSQQGYETIQIMASPGTDASDLSSRTIEYFNDLYSNNPNWNFQCQDMASELNVISQVLDVITIAIAVIAAISLLVGGIGVMNIMLVSIIERTKEIGIRKALGAKNSSIRTQFLTEAIVICLIGGTIGILIGIANGFLIAKAAVALGSQMAADYMDILTITVQPSMTAILVSVFFSMLIGILFGYYPANRAAKMSPIDALRYE